MFSSQNWGEAVQEDQRGPRSPGLSSTVTWPQPHSSFLEAPEDGEKLRSFVEHSQNNAGITRVSRFYTCGVRAAQHDGGQTKNCSSCETVWYSKEIEKWRISTGGLRRLDWHLVVLRLLTWLVVLNPLKWMFSVTDDRSGPPLGWSYSEGEQNELQIISAASLATLSVQQ